MGYAPVATHETEQLVDVSTALETSPEQMNRLPREAQQNSDKSTFLSPSEASFSSQTVSSTSSSPGPHLHVDGLLAVTTEEQERGQAHATTQVKASAFQLLQQQQQPVPRSARQLCRRAVFGACVAAVLVGILVCGSKFAKSKEFNGYVQWFEQHPWTGGLLYVACFCVWTICCLPSTACEILAGSLFQPFSRALILATCGKLSGCLVSFAIGRYLCRDRVRKYMEQSAYAHLFRAFRLMLAKNQVLVVVLTRLAFFPIALKNYGLSALDVAFEVFVMATFLTGIGFTLVWISVGATARQMGSWVLKDQDHTALTSTTVKVTTSVAMTSSDAADSSVLASQKAQTELILMAFGALSACVLLAVVGYYTKQQLLEIARAEEQTEQEETDEASSISQA